MAFELSQFTKALAGAGARASLFEVTLTKTPVINTANDGTETNIADNMKFSCRATTIPGLTVTQIDTVYFGRTIKTPGELEFGDWTTTILNDNNYRVRRAVERWMAGINSHSGNKMDGDYGASSNALTGTGNELTGGVYPWTGTAQIQQYNKLGTATHKYTLEHIWPTAIDPQDMNYDNTGTIQEYGITWALDWWDYAKN